MDNDHTEGVEPLLLLLDDAVGDPVVLDLVDGALDVVLELGALGDFVVERAHLLRLVPIGLEDLARLPPT